VIRGLKLRQSKAIFVTDDEGHAAPIARRARQRVFWNGFGRLGGAILRRYFDEGRCERGEGSVSQFNHSAREPEAKLIT
jgi:hypothetical protein